MNARECPMCKGFGAVWMAPSGFIVADIGQELLKIGGDARTDMATCPACDGYGMVQPVDVDGLQFVRDGNKYQLRITRKEREP